MWEIENEKLKPTNTLGSEWSREKFFLPHKIHLTVVEIYFVHIKVIYLYIYMYVKEVARFRENENSSWNCFNIKWMWNYFLDFSSFISLYYLIFELSLVHFGIYVFVLLLPPHSLKWIAICIWPYFHFENILFLEIPKICIIIQHRTTEEQPYRSTWNHISN